MPELNFWAPDRISNAAVRHFREHNGPARGGRILNISPGGFMSNPITADGQLVRWLCTGHIRAYPHSQWRARL